MSASKHIALSELNSLDHACFVRVVGPVFEDSSWIAEITWLKRPFASVEALHRELCQAVVEAGQEAQIALIRAQPDLVGRAARAGTLTRESTSEHASAGLNQLTPEEIALFEDHNAAYKMKFGFPFVICARLNKKAAILEGFRTRQQNTREQEIKTALEEIFKIAELRLRDLIAT